MINNEQVFVEVEFKIEDSEFIEKIETMAAKMGISSDEVVNIAIKNYVASRRNEQILNSIPTVDLVRALVKREYVNDIVIKSNNIRVIMLPNEVACNESI